MNSTRVPSQSSTTLSPQGPTTFQGEPATALTSEDASGPIGLLEGTELVGEFKSSGYREASRLVCRSDGRLVRLSPVLYAVVSALDHRPGVAPAGRAETLSRAAERVSGETGLELTADHIAYLMDGKLAPLGITTDSNGRSPGSPSSPTGADRLLAWAEPLGVERTWAIESASGLGRLLAQQLVAAGENVVDVPPTLAARVRLLGSTKAAKNDPNDALGTAVAVVSKRLAREPPW